MNTLKMIERSVLKSAKTLSAMELNGIRFSLKHTVLTPKRLEASAGAGERRKGDGTSSL